MRLTKEEKKALYEYLRGYLEHHKVQQMETYIQHGSVSTLQHCRNVCRMSLWLNRRFRLGADERSLVVGALLHDFYLYDWHDEDDGAHKLHGFTHPKAASANAKKIFGIGKKEQAIIESHMWPLTFRAVPSSREAVIVCLADKYCSTWETIFMRAPGARPLLD